MEKQMYRTFVKAGVHAPNNTFIAGIVEGIMTVICEPSDLLKKKRGYAVMAQDDGVILTTKCEAEHYELFTRIVEHRYPDMCVFDYKFE